MYQDGVYLIYPPRATESRHGGQYVLLLFLIYLFSTIPVGPII